MSEKANENNQILFKKPHSLHIGKYIYLYKDELKNNFFHIDVRIEKIVGFALRYKKLN